MALDEARRRQAAGDIAGAIDSAKQALSVAPSYAAAMEFLALALVTRKRAFGEGLAFADTAVSARPDDAGLWYTRGWCYEFAAHELRRGRGTSSRSTRDLYLVARDSFERCLALHPDGKLAGDAEDLLDHVENELAQN